MGTINFSALMDGDDEVPEPLVVTIQVRGRISNVRWLETEYGARKEPYTPHRSQGTYTQYAVEMNRSEEQKITDLLRRLQEEREFGAGIWFEVDE